MLHVALHVACCMLHVLQSFMCGGTDHSSDIIIDAIERASPPKHGRRRSSGTGYMKVPILFLIYRHVRHMHMWLHNWMDVHGSNLSFFAIAGSKLILVVARIIK